MTSLLQEMEAGLEVLVQIHSGRYRGFPTTSSDTSRVVFRDGHLHEDETQSF